MPTPTSKTAFLGIKLTADEKDRIDAAAKAEDRSTSSWARRALLAALVRHD